MNAAALLALQHIDSALDAVANRRPRLPEVPAQREAQVAVNALRNAQRETQAAIDAAQAAIEASETKAAGVASKRARLEAQLKTVIAPREAEALMSEIRTLDTERSELDDAELVAMEEQGAAEQRLADLAAQEPALVAALADADGALAGASAALDAEQAALSARRPDAVAALSASELAAYDRARKQFGGVAVAALDGHRCNGCHLDLSPAELDEIKAVPAGEAAECPQCSRFLVR